MKRNYFVPVVTLLAFAPARIQTNTPQLLPLTQNWTTTTLITVDDNWSGVAGIQGFLGDYTTGSPTAVDPQTILVDMATIDVIANQASPNTLVAGGVAEFDGLANPTIALQGSGTADAPNIIFYLNTTSLQNINVAYNLRDIDGAVDNAVQPVALQYRVGNTGSFTNVPAGFVPDATSGPSLATLVTAVSAALPSVCDNQPEVQVRVITSNAAGSDEWVGIDDIIISGQALIATPVNLVSFSGYRQANLNQLNWATNSENNNRGFEIQRATDGINYVAIGFVNSQAPAGNSATQLNYTFTDNSLTGSRQYYRLRQVNLDNSSKYSNIVLIKGDRGLQMTIDGLYPNPATTRINVLVEATNREKVTLVLSDMSGKIIMQTIAEVQTGNNTIPIEISTLANGTYAVKLVCSNGCENVVSKLVKQ